MKSDIWRKIIDEIKNEESLSENTTNFPNQPLRLRCGSWIADMGGVRREYFNKKSGEVITKTASAVPIMPTQLFRNAETGLYRVELKTYTRGSWHSVICDRSQISSVQKIVQLADKGIEVTQINAALLIEYLNDCITLSSDIIPIKDSVSHMGWFGNSFVPYDRDVYISGDAEYNHILNAVREKGELSEWVRFINPLRENICFRLQMAASFASPLLEKLDMLPFVFHLWGGTGTGKTVGLMAAMSVWGNPKPGQMTRTMNMTANAMLSTSAVLRNLPFGGDELQIIKRRGENYDRLIMSCTEGVDRGRMTYSSLNQTRSWRCAYLFTGEEPCTKRSSGGGAQNRVISCKVNGSVVKDGNSVVRFINENYGTAGREFIRRVKEDTDKIREIFSIYLDMLNKKNTTDKQAMAMAAILTGDYFACEYIFGGSPLLTEDVEFCLASGDKVNAATRAREFTEGLIAANINHFSVGNNHSEIWGRTEPDCVYINKGILCRELERAGFDFDAVKTEWAKEGFLLRNSQDRIAHYTTCYGTKAYFVKLKISRDVNS